MSSEYRIYGVDTKGRSLLKMTDDLEEAQRIARRRMSLVRRGTADWLYSMTEVYRGPALSGRCVMYVQRHMGYRLTERFPVAKQKDYEKN